jgi:hypothetical protein
MVREMSANYVSGTLHLSEQVNVRRLSLVAQSDEWIYRSGSTGGK